MLLIQGGLLTLSTTLSANVPLINIVIWLSLIRKAFAKTDLHQGPTYRVRNLKFTRNLKFATSKTSVNFMKKMLFLSKNWHFSVQKALIYYTFSKSHHNSYILLVFSHVANFRYVANFRFLTLSHNIVYVSSMATKW